MHIFVAISWQVDFDQDVKNYLVLWNYLLGIPLGIAYICLTATAPFNFFPFFPFSINNKLTANKIALIPH